MIFHTTALSAAIETIGCDLKVLVFVIEAIIRFVIIAVSILTVFEFMFVFFVEAVPLVTTALPVAVEAIGCFIFKGHWVSVKTIIGFSIEQ